MSPTITDMRHARLASNFASLGGRTITPPDSITSPTNSMKSVTVNVYCFDAGSEVSETRDPNGRDSSTVTVNPLFRKVSGL